MKITIELKLEMAKKYDTGQFKLMELCKIYGVSNIPCGLLFVNLCDHLKKMLLSHSFPPFAAAGAKLIIKYLCLVHLLCLLTVLKRHLNRLD